MDRQDIDSVIECAGLAPSVHNTQPWTLSAVGDEIEVRADRTRALPILDPHGRELTISCGAAAEFARIAVRGLGWECAVHLLPEAAGSDLLARLTIGTRRAANAYERDLMEAIPRRYTDRGRYLAMTIAPELRGELEHEVNLRGAWLRTLDHTDDRLAVNRALSAAEATQAADPAYRQELASWMRQASAVDGIPPKALVDAQPSNSVTDVTRRDFTGQNIHRQPGGEGAPPAVERDALLMIGTSEDSPRSWLDAGRATGWLLLRLTVAGFSSQPLGQALDIESSRQRLGHQLGLLGHVQFLLRTGEGHGLSTTGRRHLSAHA